MSVNRLNNIIPKSKVHLLGYSYNQSALFIQVVSFDLLYKVINSGNFVYLYNMGASTSVEEHSSDNCGVISAKILINGILRWVYLRKCDCDQYTDRSETTSITSLPSDGIWENKPDIQHTYHGTTITPVQTQQTRVR